MQKAGVWVLKFATLTDVEDGEVHEMPHFRLGPG